MLLVAVSDSALKVSAVSYISDPRIGFSSELLALFKIREDNGYESIKGMHQLHDFLDTIQPLGSGIHNNLSPIQILTKISRTLHMRDKQHTMEDRSFTGDIDGDKR